MSCYVPHATQHIQEGNPLTQGAVPREQSTKYKQEDEKHAETKTNQKHQTQDEHFAADRSEEVSKHEEEDSTLQKQHIEISATSVDTSTDQADRDPNRPRGASITTEITLVKGWAF